MDKDILVGCITAVLIILILVLGVAISYNTSVERNIEKELKLKEIYDFDKFKGEL